MQFSKTLFSFLSLFPFLAFSWDISQISLQEKLKNEPPLWMQKRIESDLTYFNQGLSSDEIDLCLKTLASMQESKNAGLVRIHFSEGIGSITPIYPINTEQTKRAEEFLSGLNLLHSLSPIPDLDLILSVSPSFDRPILLLKTSVPIFALSKERHNKKVALIPDLSNKEREAAFKTLPYDWDKKIEKAFWRGFASDGHYGHFDWDTNPRATLCLLSRHHEELLDAGLVPSARLDNSIKYWMDRLSLLSPFTPVEEQSSYKYLLSLDGCASPSSLGWQFFTHSLVFKAESNKIQWFHDELQPGVHYIPFHPRSIDLIEKILWAQSHDENAYYIAEKGYEFAEEHLLDEELFLYLFHLIQSYSRLFF